MKKLIYIIIILLIIRFIPVIPYDKEVYEGVTIIEYKPAIEWLINNF